MSKDQINQFDSTASNNTDIEGINTSETMVPSAVNNSIRSMMSLLKKQDVGTHAMTSPDINGGTVDGAVIGGSSSAAGTFTNVAVNGTFTVGVDDTGHDAKFYGATSGRYMLWDESADSLVFPDNVRSVWGSSFEVFHDGANTYLTEVGESTGNVYFRGNNLVLLNNVNDTYINCVTDGAVTLYHDNSAKLATASGGISVTGDVNATTFIGNLTGNASGTAATVTGAAQTAITSVGTLTALTVSGLTTSGTMKATSRLFVGDIATALPVSQGMYTWTQSHDASNRGGVTWYSTHNSAGATEAVFAKGRSGAIGSFTTVQDGDTLGSITWCADDGTDMNSVAARISAQINGTPGSDDTPGRLTFHTTGDGTNNPSERVRVLSDGKVAINKTSSTEFLEVHGAIGSSHSAANFGAGDARANLDFATGAGGTRVGSINGNYGTVFLANSGEKGRFAATGEFSVNNTSATGMINVTATSWSKNCLYLNSSTSGDADFCGIGMTTAGTESANIYTDETHNFSITRRTGGTFYLKSGSSGISGGTTQLTLNDNGDLIVGGTASVVKNGSGADVGGKWVDCQPGTAVYGGFVAGSTGRASSGTHYRQGFFLRRSDGWETSRSGMWKGSESSGSDVNYWERLKISNGGGGGSIDFVINDALKMVLKPDGKLAIGNDAPSTTLDVTGSFQATTSIKSLGVYNNTTGTAANLVVDSAGSFARSTSSRRYKNTITDATNGLTELLALRPVTYKHNGNGDTVFGGLIAEEVHDAGLTEFVDYSQDDDGNDQPEALHYANMVSLCIKAIQEQTEQIEALEARISNLEGE